MSSASWKPLSGSLRVFISFLTPMTSLSGTLIRPIRSSAVRLSESHSWSDRSSSELTSSCDTSRKHVSSKTGLRSWKMMRVE